MQCFLLAHGVYELQAAGSAGETLRIPDFDGLAIALERLWLEV